jgi:hypothetical protein
MRGDVYLKGLLTAVVILLGVLVVRPAVNPLPVQAQGDSRNIYVEPGTTLLRQPDGTRQVQGKVMIDLRTGDVYGFPTLSGAPYPVDPINSKAPVSQPMYLGKFDLANMHR